MRLIQRALSSERFVVLGVGDYILSVLATAEPHIDATSHREKAEMINDDSINDDHATFASLEAIYLANLDRAEVDFRILGLRISESRNVQVMAGLVGSLDGNLGGWHHTLLDKIDDKTKNQRRMDGVESRLGSEGFPRFGILQINHHQGGSFCESLQVVCCECLGFCAINEGFVVGKLVVVENLGDHSTSEQLHAILS